MQLFSEAYNARNLKERINGAGLSLAEQLFGHPGKRAGSGIQYSHPHMEQRTPSFTVYPSGSFKDYKTGEHGNVFDLIMLVTGCRFPEACNYVAQFVGVSAVTQDFQPVKSTPRPVQRSLEQSEQWRDAAEKLVTDAQRKLWNGSTESTHVLNYLHGRGLTDASIRSGGFGYVSTWTPSAFWDENGKRANLAPGIIIPWRDPAGKLTNIRIRRRVGTLARALGIQDDMDRGQPVQKYISFRGSRTSGVLYVATPVMVVRSVLFVEGEFDALLAAQTLGDEYAVVTLGSASNRLSDYWCDVIKKNVANIYLALDNDSAGDTARAMLAAKLQDARLFTVTMPDGVKDVTDAVLGGHDLETLIKAAQTVVPRADPIQPATTPIAPPTQQVVTDALHAHKPLSMAARFALLNIAEPFILVGELIATTGIGVDQPVAVAQFKATSDNAGAGLSERTIRRAVEWAVEKGVIVKESCRESLNKELEVSIGQSDNNLGGRPEIAYQLASVDALREIFRELAEHPAVKRRFVNKGIVPTPRADVVENYGELTAIEAEEIAANLWIEIQPKVDVQPNYQTARRAAQKDVDRYLVALMRTEGSVPLDTPYPTLYEYRRAVLRRFVAEHDGEPHSRAYLARLVNCSVRRVVELLESAGVASEHAAPIVQPVSIPVARAIVERVMTTGRCEFNFELKAYPIALTIGIERIALKPSAVGVAEHFLKCAEGKPITIEYNGADIRRIGSETLPKRSKRKAEKLAEETTQPVQKTLTETVSTPESPTESVVAPTNEPVTKSPVMEVQSTPCVTRTDREWDATCVFVVERWLSMATAWNVDDGRIINTATGEMLPYTRRNVLVLLQGKKPLDVWLEHPS